jgi:hypothetical protein
LPIHGVGKPNERLNQTTLKYFGQTVPPSTFLMGK